MGPEHIGDVGILKALESLNFARLPLQEGDSWCKACYTKARKHASRPRYTPLPTPQPQPQPPPSQPQHTSASVGKENASAILSDPKSLLRDHHRFLHTELKKGPSMKSVATAIAAKLEETRDLLKASLGTPTR